MIGTKKKGGVGRNTYKTHKMVLLMKERETLVWIAIRTLHDKRDAITLAKIMIQYSIFISYSLSLFIFYTLTL